MYQYQFPRMKGLRVESNCFSRQLDKIAEELAEVRQAMNGAPEEREFDTAVELFDVIHAAESALRMVAEESSYNSEGYSPLLEKAYEAVITKNAERGYYANMEGWL